MIHSCSGVVPKRLCPVHIHYCARTFLGTHFETKNQTVVLKKSVNAQVPIVYQVISDIARYQEFMPYCVESYVSQKNKSSRVPEAAGLRVQFRNYDETFACKVSCIPTSNNSWRVVAESVTHSLFTFLQTKWTIEQHPTRPNASAVELTISYQFKSSLYNSVASIFGKSMAQIVMKAFEKRIFLVRKESEATSA
ncbi:LAMI_0B07536g1_1 [Lachancea mirantina]|uniref:LAMI_0B07536g1_1 n=1 Tax=Lachancea mirantina TaxID=1230905 RepID=A0A1G4IXJ3_9SACH|nr:LAMI_0B07536g1_1 [Lachancea mirantina]